MTEALVFDFVVWLLIFMRIFATFLSAPVFSSQAIPMTIKVFLAAFISYIAFLTIDKTHIQVDVRFLALAILAVKEIIIGLLMGFCINLVFYGISFAGLLIGQDMGLSMANILNPMEDMDTNVIGQAFNILATLLFFLIDGHHYIISAVVASLKVIPLGKYVINASVYQLIIKYTAGVFIIAIKIASPVMVSFFLVHLAEGILARAIPQMQIFFVTQPLKLGAGFLFIIALLPIYVYFLKNLLAGYEGLLLELIRAMSG